MPIRQATAGDLPSLYELGLETPEIQVSTTEPFMDKDEFMDCLNRKENFILIAEDGNRTTGFLMGNLRDQDIDYQNHYGCIVYIIVNKEHRGHGYAQQLYAEAEKYMREKGMTHLYCWANLESGIIPFMEKQGFQQGHQYVWMDKKIS